MLITTSHYQIKNLVDCGIFNKFYLGFSTVSSTKTIQFQIDISYSSISIYTYYV